GTPAAKIEDLTPREVKEDRLRRLNEKVVYYAKKHNLEYQDRIVEVLTDGPSKKRSDIYAGYTKENKLVNFQGKDLRPGDLVQVKITECHNFSLNGTAIEKD
ncbi:MAG: TRAM domain-containing protein, partial [Erysipelotrichaceae bacterium]|nr:TRAM domain-containing protein [Erysipelotrichaceae bacterium]